MGSKQMEMCSFPKEQNSEDSKKDIIHVPIGQLHDFRGHPFKVERDMALLELMQSIGKEGVIVPALVRPNPYGESYEMIAGHRRKSRTRGSRSGYGQILWQIIFRKILRWSRMSK